ncbi:MAG: phosphomethylpyrimidine synthase ThiC [Kiritimatiellae bacterium]|nr:phosphomethylpyrimidine synthase ThiC [Kiritimatiellia bacterium]
MNETQLISARRGMTTTEMTRVAEAERLPAETIRAGVAQGRIVIPANPAHPNLRPVGIGRALRTKVNANLGTSALSGTAPGERTKLETALEAGADTVMDLSTGPGALDLLRATMAASPAPVGTVPIYEAVVRAGSGEALTPELWLAAVEDQARLGVDYMTVHAGLRRAHVPLARQRLLGIVSRGGALTAAWMVKHRRENFAWERFDDLLDICRAHDVTLSLGDGLRPGCLADASDEAQFAELEELGMLARRCRDAGVQAMIEGPGHVPLHQIEMNMRREIELCDDAPFYVLGPLVTDCAPGHDHWVGAIGGAWMAMHGAAMLCYVTPKEHLGLPNARDVREGVIAFRVAAHAADVAKGIPGARDRDDALSRARGAFDWSGQFEYALDPGRARAVRAEALREAGLAPEDCDGDHHCTMCGPEFCAMKLNPKPE